MATNSNISLTTSDGYSFYLDANKIIYATNNGDGKAVLTFAKDTGVNADPITLSINISSLVALSTGILFTEEVIPSNGGSGISTCFNSNNVIKVEKIGDGTTCRILYNDNVSSQLQPFDIDNTFDNVWDDALLMIEVTDSASNSKYAINKQNVNGITSETDLGNVLSSATVVSRGTLMLAGTTLLTFAGGTFGVVAKGLVTNVDLASVAIAAAGTGYLVGDTLTGTSGTGTKFILTVSTVGAGGAITGLTITNHGDYTANPTSPTSPFTTSGVGINAHINVGMGAKTVSVSQAGQYSTVPSNPVSTTGGGNNATLTATWAEGSITGCQITYNNPQKGTQEVLDVEETAAQVSASIG